LTVKKVFPGSKTKHRHFDAVVIFHNEANEVNFIKDEIERYKDAPVKAFFGKVAYDRAGDYNAQAFTHDQAADLLAHLNKEYSQLEEIIRKVFASFDKDNSGFIDLNELAEVSKELGRPLDSAELEECMQDLDQNKDNQISFEEFR
jgi:Ca2+-binding EF-hand superfamily protein